MEPVHTLQANDAAALDAEIALQALPGMLTKMATCPLKTCFSLEDLAGETVWAGLSAAKRAMLADVFEAGIKSGAVNAAFYKLDERGTQLYRRMQ